ncbi:MAG: nitrite reductase small subunit NirD [Methylococcaceae bacterium]|nr:nitrite reductase small subunit NirD [Methylococcaceae bacterium]
MIWQDVCGVDDLQPNSGVCALVDQQQVAIFYLPANNQCYAINNFDPFGHANVLSRGLIGDINGQPVVASPLYKQHFNLQTGVCLEDETVKIPVYGIRINNNRVEVNVQESGNEL